MPPTSRLDALNNLPLSIFRAKFLPYNDHDDNTRFQFSTPTLPESYCLQLRTSESLSQSELMDCFDLVRGSSKEDYRDSADGWQPGKKRREMRLRDLRYFLLGREDEEGAEVPGTGALVEGFLSFMLTWEDGVEVIYCYEIHLSECVRGKGVGKRLMGYLEHVGRKAQVEKAMLTVFRRNEKAVRFYEGLGYVEDEFSPRPKKLRGGVVKEVDYLIMSKSLSGGVMNHEGERKGKRKAG